MIKKQTFLKHGIKIYLTLLISSAVLFVGQIADFIPFSVFGIAVAIFLFYMSLNVQGLIGFLANEGRLKTYNKIFLIIYNLVCLGFLLYFLGLYLGILSP